MDNNDFSELKIDATSFDDVSKLSTAINNKSYQISYDSIPDLINARCGFVPTSEFDEPMYKIKDLNEYVK